MKKILIAILMMAPLSLCAQKFAHFNTADIIPNMKEYTTAMGELEAMQKQYADDIKLMQDELQKKSEEYQKEQANLLDNVRQRREQELNDLYTRLQQSYQDNQAALQKAETEKMNVIREKVLAVVKKVGEAGGYVY
ncbi:MAG: OmpH family outer membrane protein, partial [Bacteroidaceae bacterium]|nr:OmpH family outer membrane protein [Bacteroidaceae bacterium]